MTQVTEELRDPERFEETGKNTIIKRKPNPGIKVQIGFALFSLTFQPKHCNGP